MVTIGRGRSGLRYLGLLLRLILNRLRTALLTVLSNAVGGSMKKGDDAAIHERHGKDEEN